MERTPADDEESNKNEEIVAGDPTELKRVPSVRADRESESKNLVKRSDGAVAVPPDQGGNSLQKSSDHRLRRQVRALTIAVAALAVLVIVMFIVTIAPSRSTEPQSSSSRTETSDQSPSTTTSVPGPAVTSMAQSTGVATSTTQVPSISPGPAVLDAGAVFWSGPLKFSTDYTKNYDLDYNPSMFVKGKDVSECDYDHSSCNAYALGSDSHNSGIVFALSSSSIPPTKQDCVKLLSSDAAITDITLELWGSGLWPDGGWAYILPEYSVNF